MPSAERTASQSKDLVFADSGTGLSGNSYEGPGSIVRMPCGVPLYLRQARGPSTPRLVRSANQPYAQDDKLQNTRKFEMR